MNRNKIVLCLTLIAICLLTFIPTLSEVLHTRQERMWKVATKQILEQAENCYYDGVCKDKEITLQTLQEKGYYDSLIVNPKTKTYFDLSLVIVYEDYHAHFKE